MSIFAYVDPGLGLLAWQAVAAFFVGLVFYARKSRAWIAGAVRKLIPRGKQAVAGAKMASRATTTLRR